MIGDQVLGTPKPEVGNPGQHFALAGNGLGKNDIKSRQTICGDDEHGMVVDSIDVAHLASVDEFKV